VSGKKGLQVLGVRLNIGVSEHRGLHIMVGTEADLTENRLNVEHRTPNIERPILMTLRFIYFKTREPLPATSSPQRARGLRLSEGSRIEFRRVDSLYSVFLN